MAAHLVMTVLTLKKVVWTSLLITAMKCMRNLSAPFLWPSVLRHSLWPLAISHEEPVLQMDSCLGISPIQITCPRLLSLRCSKNKGVLDSVFCFHVPNLFCFLSSPYPLLFVFFLDPGSQ